MADCIVQLKGFPNWTSREDLQVIVEEFGYTIHVNGISISGQMAEIAVPSWGVGEKMVVDLHKFEYTPGYPLLARIKPELFRQAAKGSGKGSKESKGSEGGKGSKESKGDKGGKAPEPSTALAVLPEPSTDLAVPAAAESESLEECVGAGRIEGWFVSNKALVDRWGTGNVQSYSFMGNLLFRPVNSPHLPKTFAQKDPVSFEVMKIKGKYEAVRLAVPGVEEENEAVNETAVVECEEPQEGAPSGRSQMRRLREESDACMLFVGNFGKEVSEAVLWKFAEQVGEVKKVKIFLNPQTWVSKGCGKVHYATEEGAERALQELAGTVLNDRIVLIERLGQSSNDRKEKRAKYEPKPPPPRLTDDMPKQLPLTLFSKDDTAEDKMKTCIAAFEDLLHNHDADATGVSLILMIRGLIMEVNDLFGDDEASLKDMGFRFRKYQWFWDNQQQVKWQESRKRLNISKHSGPHPNQYREVRQSWQQEKQAQVQLRKQQQVMMGKTLFEISEEEKAEALSLEGTPRWS